MFYVFLFCIVIANILKRHGTSFVFRSYADLFIYMYINGSLKFEITAKRLYAASQRVL